VFVGFKAQDYDPVIIKVHIDRRAPILALLTPDECPTQRHQAPIPLGILKSLLVTMMLQ
jgi:hypothetical protein